MSLSQARGHARVGEKPLRPSKFDPALEDALKAMRAGESLTAAASVKGVSRERLSTYAKTQAGAGREGRFWTFNDRRRRRIQIIENGAVKVIWVEGYEYARLAGQHISEADRLMGDHRRLAQFVRRWDQRSIRDASGNRHSLTVDPNEIYQAFHANDQPFDQIYKLVMIQ